MTVDNGQKWMVVEKEAEREGECRCLRLLATIAKTLWGNFDFSNPRWEKGRVKLFVFNHDKVKC